MCRRTRPSPTPCALYRAGVEALRQSYAPDARKTRPASRTWPRPACRKIWRATWRCWRRLAAALDVALLAHDTGSDAGKVGGALFRAGRELGLDRLRALAGKFAPPEHWDRLALRRLMDDLSRAQRGIAAQAAGEAARACEDWAQTQAEALERTRAFLDTLEASGELSRGQADAGLQPDPEPGAEHRFRSRRLVLSCAQPNNRKDTLEGSGYGGITGSCSSCRRLVVVAGPVQRATSWTPLCGLATAWRWKRPNCRLAAQAMRISARPRSPGCARKPETECFHRRMEEAVLELNARYLPFRPVGAGDVPIRALWRPGGRSFRVAQGLWPRSLRPWPASRAS